MRSLRTLAIAAAATAAMAMPALAVTNGQLGRQSFQTQLMQIVPGDSAGGYPGVLNVTIGKDGTVNGFYREEDRSEQRDVVGGLQGDKIWLEIGGEHPLHVNGTYKSGEITGYTLIGNDEYEFDAKASAPAL